MRFSFQKYKRNTSRRVVQILKNLKYVGIMDPIYLSHLRQRYFEQCHGTYRFDDVLTGYEVYAFVRPFNDSYRHVIMVTNERFIDSAEFYVFDSDVVKVQSPFYATHIRLEYHHFLASVKNILDPKRQGHNSRKVPHYRSIDFSYWRYFKRLLLKK